MRKHYHFVILILFIFSKTYSQENVIANILQTNYLGGAEPRNFFKFHDDVYFTADNSINGRELWRFSNGNPVIVKDIKEGSESSFEYNYKTSDFLITDDFVYFTLNNYKELWRTDGTSEGTSLLFSDLSHDFPEIRNLIIHNNKIYFIYNNGTIGSELYYIDLSTLQLQLVKDIYVGSGSSYPQKIFKFQNKLFFVANDGINGNELWYTDGTVSGTHLLKNIHTSPYTDGIDYDYANFLLTNNAFFFYANSLENGRELWKSDGTSEGTLLVKDINPGTNSSSLYGLQGAVISDKIVFSAYYPGYGYELWISDGTNNGTFLLKDIKPGSGDGVPFFYIGDNYVTFDGNVYFMAEESNSQNKLWITNGTSEGTFQLFENSPGQAETYNNFLSYNGHLYFQNGITLFRTNGLNVEPLLNFEFDIENYGGGLESFIISNDKIHYVKMSDLFNGKEIWTINQDGSNNIIYDLNTVQTARPRNFNSFDNKIIYLSYDYNYKEVLTVSDGTPNGTKSILKNQNFSTGYNDPPNFFRAGNNLFFVANEANYNLNGLFKTDGTPEGTTVVRDFDISSNWYVGSEIYGELDGILYFIAYDTAKGLELYRSDGTLDGTYMVKDISENNYSTAISSFAKKDGLLYFAARKNLNTAWVTNGIWSTDGTAGGTELKIEFEYQQNQNHNVYIVDVLNDKLIVYKNKPFVGVEIYATQGDQESLTLLSTLQGNNQGYGINSHIVYNDKLYFSIGDKLYVSDGTPEGTYLFSESSNFQYKIKDFKICGNYLYFLHSDNGLTELWRTDGTNSGTVKLIDREGNYYSHFKSDCFNNHYIFTKGNTYRNELNITNGEFGDIQTIEVITENDHIFQDNEGITNIYVNNLKLYLSIYTKPHGEEIYITNANLILNSKDINEGLEDISDKFVLYPNPAKNEVNILSNDQSKIKKVQLFDLTGKLLSIGIFDNKEVKFNVNNLKSGIYLVKVQSENYTSTKKLVIN
jgi:ELWxxDGT repeat protein